MVIVSLNGLCDRTSRWRSLGILQIKYLHDRLYVLSNLERPFMTLVFTFNGLKYLLLYHNFIHKKDSQECIRASRPEGLERGLQLHDIQETPR